MKDVVGLNLSAPMRALMAMLLVNAPFWWLGHSRFLSRAVTDLDSLVALAVMAVRPLLGGALLVLAWLLDAVVSQSLAYHFQSPLEFIQSIRFATVIGWSGFIDLQLLAVLLPFAGALGLLLVLVGRCRPVAPLLLISAMALAVVDVLNGSSLLSSGDEWRAEVNVAGSPAATIGRLALQGVAPAPLRRLPEASTARAMTDLPRWASEHSDGAILVVVVESMGAPLEPALQSWLDGRLHSPRHSVVATRLPFQGSTTSGELRSLCALTGYYGRLGAAEGEGCLPAQLARLGWSTLGLHGFSERMFDRRSWWPRLGLQQMAFVDDSLLAEAGRCGSAFVGACDADVLAAAGRWLREGGRRFAYVLTLNTHLPLPPVPAAVPPELQSVCDAHAVDGDACHLVAALGAVLDAIAQQVAASPRPLLAVVVGDHAPPFNRHEARAAFSPRQVPAYLMQPVE